MLERGARIAVYDKTYNIYQREPYAKEIIGVEPYENIPLKEARSFDCKRAAKRHPRETKELDYNLTDLSGARLL